MLSRSGWLIAAMAPKGKGRAAAAPPKRKGAMQSQLNQLPLLKKPSELIGTQIKVPGAYWDGRMSDEEKAMLYLCGIRDYSALHTFASGAKGQAFELQEMGAAGRLAAWSTAMRVARSSGCSIRFRCV